MRAARVRFPAGDLIPAPYKVRRAFHLLSELPSLDGDIKPLT